MAKCCLHSWSPPSDMEMKEIKYKKLIKSKKTNLICNTKSNFIATPLARKHAIVRTKKKKKGGFETGQGLKVKHLKGKYMTIAEVFIPWKERK